MSGDYQWHTCANCGHACPHTQERESCPWCKTYHTHRDTTLTSSDWRVPWDDDCGKHGPPMTTSWDWEMQRVVGEIHCQQPLRGWGLGYDVYNVGTLRLHAFGPLLNAVFITAFDVVSEFATEYAVTTYQGWEMAQAGARDGWRRWLDDQRGRAA